jgi:hypothetical protein
MGCGWHVHCVCLACLMWLACALRGIFQPYHAASVLLDIQHVGHVSGHPLLVALASVSAEPLAWPHLGPHWPGPGFSPSCGLFK